MPQQSSNSPSMASNGGHSTPKDDAASRASQSSSSRMMKTTQRGRPFTKDTHDLFATLIVSLQLTTHRQLFKTFNNSFTTDEAAENLSALKFSQSNRVPDPKDPSRVVTTTTTTTFSMSRDMAKGICQHFMDARLIENAADVSSTVFKEKGIYMLTPKGLHLLERFITKNGINGEHLLKVFSSQPICMKLLHLERRLHDDELVVTRGVLEVIFRRFAGRQPNYPPATTDTVSTFDRTLGIEVVDLTEKVKSSTSGVRTTLHTFSALNAVEWLLDFTTMCGRDEAAEMAAHFVRLRYIELVHDRKAKDESEHLVTVQGEDELGGTSAGELRCHGKALYAMTDWGRTVARWPGYNANESGQTASYSSQGNSSLNGASSIGGHGSDVHIIQGKHAPHYSEPGYPSPPQSDEMTRSNSSIKSPNLSESLRGGLFAGDISTSANTRDSNSKRLRQILEEPALRSLFRDFLKQNFCEENLSFWLDVQDFKRRFHTTSSAVAVRGDNNVSAKDVGMVGKMRKLGVGRNGSSSKEHNGYTAMEKHQRDLIAMAFVIYNTYLAPSSSCELNIEHSLRSDLVNYMNKILAEARGADGVNQINASDLKRSADGSRHLEDRRRAVNATMPRAPLHASQLQAMVRLYERIQEHIFRLMATDSVPRFIKDPRFLSLVRSVEEYTEALEAGRIDPMQNAGPGLGKSVVDALDLRGISHGSGDGEVEAKEVLNDRLPPGYSLPPSLQQASSAGIRRPSSSASSTKSAQMQPSHQQQSSTPTPASQQMATQRSNRSNTVTTRDVHGSHHR